MRLFIAMPRIVETYCEALQSAGVPRCTATSMRTARLYRGLRPVQPGCPSLPVHVRDLRIQACRPEISARCKPSARVHEWNSRPSQAFQPRFAMVPSPAAIALAYRRCKPPMRGPDWWVVRFLIACLYLSRSSVLRRLLHKAS